jgi:WD40-like Beta Propeller Repeat
MNRFWLVAFLLVFLLAACSRSPIVTSPELKGIFSDSDIDKASLSLATQVEDALGVQEAEISGLTSGKALPNSNADVKSDFETQAGLPNAKGIVYYIQNDPSRTDPWQMLVLDPASGGESTYYAGNREIQAVGGSEDGNIFVLSMRETTSATSDFEIYKFILSEGIVLKLTNNSVNDINVSLSADGKVVTWQTSISSVSSVIFRTYSSNTAFTQKKILTPASTREPSLSGNGKFITYIYDRPDGKDQLWKYNLGNNIYTAIYSTPDTTAFMTHPTITDDGNRIMFLVKYPTNQDIQYIDLTTNQRRSAVYSTRTLEHPFITADGKYLTYGYSGQLPSTNPGDFSVYIKEIATGQLAGVSYPYPNVKQFGMSWQLEIPIIAPNIPLVYENQKLNTGGSLDVSETTAVFGTNETIDVNGNGVIDCDFDLGWGTECITGKIHIVERNTQGIWNIVKKIRNPSTQFYSREGEEFAADVAISGDIVVVSAPGKEYDADGNGIIACEAIISSNNDFSECNLGIVYIFSRNQGGTNNWDLIKTLKAPDNIAQFPSQRFGNSVDVVGNTIVIGNQYAGHYEVNGDNRNSCPSVPAECVSGSVYVFSQNQGGANNWGLIKQIKSANQLINESFGSGLDLSGDNLIVASPEKYYVDATGTAVILQPSFYIYSRNQGGSNNWGLVRELAIDPISDQFNSFQYKSIDLNNDTAIVGIVDERKVNEKNIYIYSRNQGGTNNWGLVKRINPTNIGIKDAFFSAGVSDVLGDTILINSGDSYDANKNGVVECGTFGGVECNLGVVYMLSRNQGGANNWGISKMLVASDALALGSFNGFGSAKLNSNTIFVSASSTYIYQY